MAVMMVDMMAIVKVAKMVVGMAVSMVEHWGDDSVDLWDA